MTQVDMSRFVLLSTVNTYRSSWQLDCRRGALFTRVWFHTNRSNATSQFRLLFWRSQTRPHTNFVNRICRFQMPYPQRRWPKGSFDHAWDLQLPWPDHTEVCRHYSYLGLIASESQKAASLTSLIGVTRPFVNIGRCRKKFHHRLCSAAVRLLNLFHITPLELYPKIKKLLCSGLICVKHTNICSIID